MSKYTTLLRWIIEQELDNKKLAHKEDNWKYIWKKIGLNDYPIFDESHREELNKKIIRRYYFREIGFETSELFAWKLREFLFEIMPYYNQLYESELIEIDPTIDYREIYDGEWQSKTKSDRDTEENENATLHSETENESTDDATTNNRTTFHDTPMSMLNEEEPTQIEMMKWATNVSYSDTVEHDESNSSGTADNERNRTRIENQDVLSKSDGTSGHVEYGFRHAQADLLMKYRETFLNIDEEIVKKCNALFFGLW